MRARCGIVTFVLAIALAMPAVAQSIPGTMNYQGRLTDNTPNQTPVNTTVGMEFRIFASQTGSDLLWTETWPAVSVTQGLFSVMLGTSTPIPPQIFAGGVDRWLEIVVNGGALAPRQRIGSVGYAGRAETCADSDRLGGASAASFARTDVNQTFSSVVNLANPLNSIMGSFAGDGALIGNLNASRLTNGTVPGDRLQGAYAQMLAFTNSANVLRGDGSGVTNVNAAQLQGRTPDQMTNAYSRQPAPGCTFDGSSVVCAGEVCVEDVNNVFLHPTCAQGSPTCRASCVDASQATLSDPLPTRTFTRLGDYNVSMSGVSILCKAAYSVTTSYTVRLVSLASGFLYGEKSFSIAPISPFHGYTSPATVAAFPAVTRFLVNAGDTENLAFQVVTSASNPSESQCYVTSIPLVDERLYTFGGPF